MNPHMVIIYKFLRLLIGKKKKEETFRLSLVNYMYACGFTAFDLDAFQEPL